MPMMGRVVLDGCRVQDPLGAYLLGEWSHRRRSARIQHRGRPRPACDGGLGYSRSGPDGHGRRRRDGRRRCVLRRRHSDRRPQFPLHARSSSLFRAVSRRASCCRDCSPPRPSCSALRTSLCCPGLRGGRRGGLGRTGSRGARSRTAGKGFDDGRGRGGAAGRTRGPARRRPSPRPGRAPGRGAWVSAVPPVDRVRHGDPRISSSSGIPGGRSEADGPGGGRGQTDGLGLGGGFEDHSSAGSPHRGTRRPDPVGAAVAVDGCPGSRDA